MITLFHPSIRFNYWKCSRNLYAYAESVIRSNNTNPIPTKLDHVSVVNSHKLNQWTCNAFFLTSSLYLLHFTSDLFQFAHKAFLLCQIYNSMIHVMMFDTRCLAVVVFLHSVTYSRQLFVILNINVRLLFNNFLLYVSSK